MTQTISGPPNHAAHTAGRVQRGDEPLHAPPPSPPPRRRPFIAPLPVDEVQSYLAAVGRLLGDGWGVFVWEEPYRVRFGIRGRHECGFAMEATVNDSVHIGSSLDMARRLGAALLAKERRHSCDVFSAVAP